MMKQVLIAAITAFGLLAATLQPALAQTVIAEADGQVLTQAMVDRAIETGELVAEIRFTPE